MILVEARQVSYENEIIDLARVFFPNDTVDFAQKYEMPLLDTPSLKATSPEVPLPDAKAHKFTLIKCGYETGQGATGQGAVSQGGCHTFYARLIEGTGETGEHSGRIQEHRLQQYIAADNDNALHRNIKNALKGCVYELLSAYTGRRPKWGILTGIRPVKLVNQMIREGMPKEDIRKEVVEAYRIHPEKADLMLEVADVQAPYVKDVSGRTACLYIHVPFCASRCNYCSFPSDLISRVSDRMDQYLDCVQKELMEVFELFSIKGTTIDTLYIGGGTPTVLELPALKRLLDIIRTALDSLPGSHLLEFTVEAGRPDSLDDDKLMLMKDYGVTRLSINPQSMNQRTLDLIGRNHTVDDIKDIYHKARRAGFDNINMDVIAGLPGETAEDFNKTMEEIARLEPDNITVHTLAVKRGSLLKDSFSQYDPEREGLAEAMAEICHRWIDKLHMVPYYLYRQKYMLDHMENIGYCRPGKECLYNIHIMEEKRSIWAFGAGAASKVYYPDEDRIERIANVKSLKDYIERIDQMIEKKRKVLLLG